MGFREMETTAARMMAWLASGGRMLYMSPIPARMKENSPTCARATDTLSASGSGRRRHRTTA